MGARFPESNPNNRTGLTTIPLVTARYAPGIGRLVWHENQGDTLIYDPSGNLAINTLFSNTGQLSARTYYGTDQHLRMQDSWSYATDPFSHMVIPSSVREVVEEYRYDALGRRVLARAYNGCPAKFDTGCKYLIRRTVWDGSAELYELQYRVDSTVAATLEVDTGAVAADSGFYGRVAYVQAGGVDRPLALIRVDYRQHYNNAYATLPPMVFAMHYGFRGLMDWGSLPNGALKYCSQGTDSSCVSASNPGSLNAFEPGPQSLQSWWGTLQTDKQDGTGLLYRRNRYYDPATARFTQEDPIGLAGGPNAYGFANGDPINFSDPFGLCPPADTDPTDCVGFFTTLFSGAGAIIGGFGGGAGGAVACSPTVVGSLPCGAAGAAVGALKGAAVGAVVGAAVDASVMFSKKGDIKQVDQAVRKALGRKPTDTERGDFRDYIHSEKKDGLGDFPFQDLLDLAKTFFGVD